MVRRMVATFGLVATILAGIRFERAVPRSVREGGRRSRRQRERGARQVTPAQKRTAIYSVKQKLVL